MTRPLTPSPPNEREDMSTGLFAGGRELSRDEVPSSLLRQTVANPDALPRYTVPTYNTGSRLYTREQLRELFTEDWPTSHVDAGHVDTFLVEHFTVRGQGLDHIVPAGEIPFDAYPDIDDDVDIRTRQQIMRQHDERRANTRRSRQLFNINGLPKFIPSEQRPSPNDTHADARRKADYINGL